MPKPSLRARNIALLVSACVLASAVAARETGSFAPAATPPILKADNEFANARGALGLFVDGAPVNTVGHPFFEPLGPNGRACATCHVPSQGMSLSVDHIRARYLATRGKDPLFAAIDGANCPTAVAAAKNKYFAIDDPANPHSLLLDHGLFRMRLPWPPKAQGQPGQPAQPGLPVVIPEFTIEVLNDPTGCNTDPKYGLNSPHPEVSVFRRPLMSANMKFVTEVSKQFGWPFDPITLQMVEVDKATGKLAGGGIMYDGRERTLESQAANAAIIHHEMIEALSPEVVRQLVDFENSVYVAQIRDKKAGLLTDEGAEGGPRWVSKRAAATVVFNGHVFPEFDAWRTSASPYRRSVARGGDIFNNRKFIVRNSAGINDTQATNFSNAFPIGCSNCHDTAGAGHESVAMAWRDIGTGGHHPTSLKADYLPTFRLTCVPGRSHPYLGRVIITHDPGRALVTGRCADIGKIKGTQIRGLAARAPYLHNGSAKTMREIIDFYDKRFNIGFAEQDKVDLENFLLAL